MRHSVPLLLAVSLLSSSAASAGSLLVRLADPDSTPYETSASSGPISDDRIFAVGGGDFTASGVADYGLLRATASASIGSAADNVVTNRNVGSEVSFDDAFAFDPNVAGGYAVFSFTLSGSQTGTADVYGPNGNSGISVQVRFSGSGVDNVDHLSGFGARSFYTITNAGENLITSVSINGMILPVASIFDTYEVKIPVTVGMITLHASMSCNAGYLTVNMSDAASSSCDAGHSFVWNGLLGVFDGNDAPVTGYTLGQAESGQDYSAPYAPVPPSVPAPAALGLLLLGCSAIGVRRR